MKKINEIINKILILPTTFNNQTELSIFQLLKETEYFENHEKVTEDLIKSVLIKNILYLDFWIDWSESKRCDSGWYILSENNNYKVAFFSSKPIKFEYSFKMKVDAIAKFIKLEIEVIRTGL